VQEVLQADWQEFAHSLHPGLHKLFLMFGLFIVLICFIDEIPPFEIFPSNYTIVRLNSQQL